MAQKKKLKNKSLFCSIDILNKKKKKRNVWPIFLKIDFFATFSLHSLKEPMQPTERLIDQTCACIKISIHLIKGSLTTCSYEGFFFCRIRMLITGRIRRRTLPRRFSTKPLPEEAKVVVIGGGSLGLGSILPPNSSWLSNYHKDTENSVEKWPKLACRPTLVSGAGHCVDFFFCLIFDNSVSSLW